MSKGQQLQLEQSRAKTRGRVTADCAGCNLSFERDSNFTDVTEGGRRTLKLRFLSHRFESQYASGCSTRPVHDQQL